MLVRAITALLGVAVLIGIWSLFKTQGLIYVCAIISFIACCEFSLMVEKNSRLVQALFVSVAYGFFLMFSFYSQSMLVFLSFFIFLVGYFILCSSQEIEYRVEKLTSWTVGILYCGAFTGIVTLGVLKFGGPFFTSLLILSFLTDTFAYLGGRAFGRTALAPKISPKKTLEGSLSGLIGGSAAGCWYLLQSTHSSPLWVLILTCVSASLFSQVGDLFESAIKRYSGVKDSGKIMPGHGGVLDRIDGLLFAGPVVYLWMIAFYS